MSEEGTKMLSLRHFSKSNLMAKYQNYLLIVILGQSGKLSTLLCMILHDIPFQTEQGNSINEDDG